jgi:hypothetical protein
MESLIMVVLHEPAHGELPACSYELVGVFDLNRAITELGAQAASDYALNGNPRKYWNGKTNGFARSVVLKPIPGHEDSRHPPTAVFVAVDSVNSGGNYPPRAELLAYRQAHPCLFHEPHWKDWSDVVDAFQGAENRASCSRIGKP